MRKSLYQYLLVTISFLHPLCIAQEQEAYSTMGENQNIFLHSKNSHEIIDRPRANILFKTPPYKEELNNPLDAMRRTQKEFRNQAVNEKIRTGRIDKNINRVQEYDF